MTPTEEISKDFAETYSSSNNNNGAGSSSGGGSAGGGNKSSSSSNGAGSSLGPQAGGALHRNISQGQVS